MQLFWTEYYYILLYTNGSAPLSVTLSNLADGHMNQRHHFVS